MPKQQEVTERGRQYGNPVAICCLYGVIGAILMICAVAFASPVMPKHKIAESTVYVRMNDRAHGSGVNIGNGYVLTAAHVADDPNIGQKHLMVVDSLHRDHKVEVLWVNHNYDVALLHISDAKTVAASHLSCRLLDRGEKLTFAGNPLDLTDVTMYGRVANPNIVEIGPWAEANSVSGQLVPGMSGGPAFDRHGYVVGINVGIAVQPTGPFGMSQLGFALSYIIPGRTICKLMDR